jgi:hypothetical protein
MDSTTNPMQDPDQLYKDVAIYWALAQYGSDAAVSLEKAIELHILNSDGWFDETLYDLSYNVTGKTVTLTCKSDNPYYSGSVDIHYNF